MDKARNDSAIVRPRRVGRPSGIEADSLERDVLAAALVEFRQHGLSGASLDRIARTANVARSAIYRRFGGRRGLFERVLERQVAELAGQAENLISAPEDSLLRLQNTALAYCRFVLSPAALDLQRIVIREAGGPHGSFLIGAVPVHLSDQLDSVIAAAQADGHLRDGPVDLWRDALLRLMVEGPRWQALAGTVIWTEADVRRDFERMWPLFLTLAATTSG